MSKSSPTQSTSAKQFLEYAAIRTLARILRVVGIDRSSAMMGTIWRCLGPLTRRHGRVMSNLRAAYPDLPETELRWIARRQWNNLGRTFAEGLLIDLFLGEPERIDLNQSVFDRLADADTGFVLVSLHTGNWELVAMPIAKRFDLTAIYQQLSNRRVDAYVRSMREKIFRAGLLTKSIRTPKQVMQIVRGGKAVGMLADHREKKGVETDFFGRRTKSNPFPAMIARRLDVPLVAGRSVRLGGARFRVDVVEIAIPRTDDVTADVQTATQAVQDQFETWIREHPGQWMWVQDRWRTSRPRRNRNAPALDKSGSNAN